MRVHIAFVDSDGDEVYKCAGATSLTFGGEKCHSLNCNARIVRLGPTLAGVRGRAYFIGTDLINKWAWDRPEGGYSYEDLMLDVDDIIINLQTWKGNLYREIKAVPRD